MSTFDEAVKRAKQSVPKPKESITVPHKTGWLYGICVPTGNYENATDKWPSYFSVVPRPGDYIESGNNRRLQVLSITHQYSKNGTSVMMIELGTKKSSDVTPTEGGRSPSV